MSLTQGIIPTPVAKPGMQIGQALRICVDVGLPGIPFVDAQGEIVGRYSVRNTFRVLSIPSDVVQGAHLIGHEAAHLELLPEHYRTICTQSIDDLVLPEVALLSSNAQITKAMAMMERFNSSYLFVIDDGIYKGAVTRLGLTRILLESCD